MSDLGGVEPGQTIVEGGGGGPLTLTLTPWQKSQLEGLSPKGVQCLVSSWISLARNPIEGPFCNAAWDEIFCWPPAKAGENVSRPCSEVMKDDTEIDAQNITGNAYRICSPGGRWQGPDGDIDGQGGQGWTNYTVCMDGISDPTDSVTVVDEDLAVVVDAVRYILFIGSILSLLCLCLALFIFNYFKSLRCDRIIVHTHLMLALALRFLLLIVISEPFIFHRTNHYRTVDWICKLVLALHFYSMVASINWMFIQGHYLHSRLTTKVFDHGIPMKLYCAIGYGVPLGLISTWALVMEMYHAKPCWKNYGKLRINWIIVGPMLFVLLVNLLFLINIMRILLTKIQLTSAASESEQFRRAVKATAILFPLLGFNNLLFFYNPGGTVETYYMLTNTVLQSSQGLVVSFLYCFCCKDVKDAIRREYGRFSARRNANSTRCQSRRSCGGSGRSFKGKILRKRKSSSSPPPLHPSTTTTHSADRIRSHHKLTTVSSTRSDMTTTVPNDCQEDNVFADPNMDMVGFLQAGDTKNVTVIPIAPPSFHLPEISHWNETTSDNSLQFFPNNGTSTGGQEKSSGSLEQGSSDRGEFEVGSGDPEHNQNQKGQSIFI